MKDPERLSIASDSEIERLLLQSGRAAAPRASRTRALLVATSVLGTSGLAAGSAKAGSAAIGSTAVKTGSVLSLKSLAFLGVTGVGAMTVAVAVDHGVMSREPSREVARATSSVATTTRPPAAPRAPETAWPRPTATQDDTAPPPASPTFQATPVLPRPAVRASAPVVEPSPPGESSVHAELASLERARGALQGGEPARALSILDAYAASYPRGTMGPEATVLRVEALVRAGDRPAAERVGDAFLAANPGSPYSTRIRSLLAVSNP